jgi:hypothetical protein
VHLSEVYSKSKEDAMLHNAEFLFGGLVVGFFLGHFFWPKVVQEVKAIEAKIGTGIGIKGQSGPPSK